MYSSNLILNGSFIKPRILLGILLLFYFVNGVFYLRAQSITSDESAFFNYAVRLLKGHPERTDPVRDNSKMPVSVINILPRAVEQLLHPGLSKSDWGSSDIKSGRYMTLLVSLFIIIIVYKWSGELYGQNAGLFSAFLISFCPNMLANAGLVTTDSYSMLFLLITMYYLWKFCNNRSVKYFIIFSICVALSQLAKQSLFHLYIIAPVTLLSYFLANRLPIRWKPVIIYTLIFLFINWLIINTGFYFWGTNTVIGNYHFTSNLFLGLQRIMPAWFPIPLPHAFVTGLDMGKYFDQLGGGYVNSSFGKVTILGRSSTGGSFWYYYFVSLFFKTPVSSLLFIAGGVVVMIKYRSTKNILNNECFLIFPVIYFLVYLSFLYNNQCGIRHIIFIYPFLYILSGSIIAYMRHTAIRISVAALSIFLVISVMRYWSNYYPYTNEFIADKKMAYSYIGASNLEFHQGNYFFDKYLLEHPQVKPVGTVPGTGVYIINTADYLDIWNLHQYDWISGIKPSGQVAYNWLLITVTEKNLRGCLNR